MSFSPQSRKVTLIAGDILVMYASLLITLTVRYQEIPSHERLLAHFVPFSFVIAVYIVSFIIVGLYELSAARNNRLFMGSLLNAVGLSTAVAMMYFYIVRPGITPRLNLALFVVFSVAFITLWRHTINRLLGRAWLLSTLIIGASPDALALAKTFFHHPQLGYALALVALGPEESSHLEAYVSEKIPARVFALDELLAYISREQIDLIIPASETHLSPALVAGLYRQDRVRARVVDFPEIFESVTGKVPVQSIGSLWFLEQTDALHKPFYEFVKRIIDIILSLLSLALTLPFAPFIYLAIKFDSAGSGFFVQQRVGKNGKQFLAIKFRSMYWGKGNDGPLQVVSGDSRVTRVGRLLRATRLDELPQLLNILKGDMSFIGPRPEQANLVDSLSATIPFYRERLTVKPGLTGWDQISGVYHSATTDDTLEKLQYDLYYIKNRTLLLDWAILLRTIKTVVSAAGR